ncbi:hypothetical protein LBMAG42_33440 [Deltaproteobacteria bacterium]|nr:hypothetical protein LBMAG42_33440 [Deltaproteobacteria bacterium]
MSWHLLSLVLIGCAEALPDDTESCSPEPVCEEGVVVTTSAERALSPPITVPHGPRQIVVGDLRGSGDRQIYVATSTTLTRLDGEGWTSATDLWTTSDTAIVPLLADLTGDGVLDLELGLPGSDGGAGQVVIFPGPVAEPLSWDSPHFELQGADGVGSELVAADLNGDGALDLKATAPGAIWVKPGPIGADEPFGSAADSTWTWDSAPDASSTVLDFDLDGGADLLFSSFEASDDCGGRIGALRLVRGPVASGEFAVAEAELVFVPPPEAAAPPWFDDADGDGFADMFLPLDTAEIAIYAGPLAAHDAPVARFSAPGIAFFTADFDGDGVLDLVQQSYYANTPLLSLGRLAELPADMLDGCAFEADEAWTGGAAFPDAGWVGDLDGDALADAIVESTAEDGSGVIQLMLGAR